MKIATFRNTCITLAILMKLIFKAESAIFKHMDDNESNVYDSKRMTTLFGEGAQVGR